MLVSNPAFLLALDIYRKLLESGPKTHSPNDPCGTGTQAMSLFGKGQCLMTFGPHVFKALSFTGSLRSDQVGISQTPGAFQVYDRKQRKMTPCTSELCPYATPITAPNKSSVNAKGAAELTSKPDAAETLYLNRAPFSPQRGWLAGISSLSPPNFQNASYHLLANLSSPAVSWLYVLNPNIGKFYTE